MKNNFFVYGYYDSGTPWLEYRILDMETNDVIIWKSYIEPNGSTDLAVFFGLAKALQYCIEKYAHHEGITLYCNEVAPAEWFNNAKCEHPLEDTPTNQTFKEMIASAERYIRAKAFSKCIIWSRRAQNPEPLNTN